MSQSLASAKKRRAPNELPSANLHKSVSHNQSAAANMQSTGLTLPQVIQLVDHRLIVLEKFMNLSSNRTNIDLNAMENPHDSQESEEVSSNIKEVIDEFDKRYELLVEEIVNLKNIVLSLQTYTMDVNKMLLEERALAAESDESETAPDTSSQELLPDSTQPTDPLPEN